MLFNKVDNHLFNLLMVNSSPADKLTCFLSPPHMLPHGFLLSHLRGLVQPSEFQVAIKQWLGLDTAGGSMCALCPENVLDSLGHHALTCKWGGDVVTPIINSEIPYLSVKVEAECSLTHDHNHSCPADILVPNWSVGKPAAFDILVTSRLNSKVLLEVELSTGMAARATEQRKHEANDGKCKELGWVCVPMAMKSLSCLASHLATSSKKTKAVVLTVVLANLYGRLNLNLVRVNATAILSRCFASDL